MKWTKENIENHIKVSRALKKILEEAFVYIKSYKNVTEYSVQQFILKQFKKNALTTDRVTPIVAFRENTSFVHYHPSQYTKKLKPESLIMIDVWARLNKKNSPFSDITWMIYYGRRTPKEVTKIFNAVIKARDEAINFIRLSLSGKKIPTGEEIDKVARGVIRKAGYEKNFLHSTGHSLGFTQPHGRGGRIWKNNQPILKSVGYTIEPGIYIKNKFGVRSEIDFYINQNMKLIITTEIQKSLIII